MKYRYQFLLELYKKRNCHPDNKVWIYQQQQVTQNKHYEKLYLYQRTKQHLDAVTFQLQYEGTILTYNITEFHQLKRQYMPYLRGCLIELPEEVLCREYTISILNYVIDGQKYEYVEDTLEINLQEEQCNDKLASLLHELDISIYPMILDTTYLCACGHLNNINEPCENCHRSFTDNTEILNKGSAVLCKEAFQKRYFNEETYQKCGNNPTAFLVYLQNIATGLPITIEEADIQGLVHAEKKSKRNTILFTSFLSCLLPLLLLLMIFVFPTTSGRNNDSVYPSSDITDYNYSDQGDTYKYTICEGADGDYPMNFILEGYGDHIDSLTIEIVMTSEDIGIDVTEIDEFTKELFRKNILKEFDLTGEETGINTDIYTYDNLFYCDVTIDTAYISDDTLEKLGLSVLKYYSYDLAVLDFQSQEGMYCY